jgi:hypothetical protein
VTNFEPNNLFDLLGESMSQLHVLPYIAALQAGDGLRPSKSPDVMIVDSVEVRFALCRAAILYRCIVLLGTTGTSIGFAVRVEDSQYSTVLD